MHRRALLLLLLLVVTVIGCGTTGILAAILGVLTGVVVADSSNRPASGVPVRALDNQGMPTQAGTITDTNGAFSLQNVPVTAIIVVGAPQGGEELFHLQGASMPSASVTINEGNVSAASNTVTISPSPSNPGGTAVISNPVSDTTVPSTAGNAGVAEFSVSGSGTPNVGSPSTGLHMYVLVQPVTPFAGGWVVHFPETMIDSTGHWQTGAQIGPTAHTGDVFTLAVVITTQQLTVPITGALTYSTPYAVPGAVYVSPFVLNLKVGTF